MNSKFLLVSLVATVILMFGACQAHGSSIPFNVTVDYPFTWTTDSFTKVMFTFLTTNTSGVSSYLDLSESNEFENYGVPTSLKEYELFGVFQIDMTKVSIPSSGAAKFSFKHDFSFGILNVNPKQVCMVGVDMTGKKFTQIDFSTGSFYNEIILPLEHSIYTFGIMAIEQEISAQFGVPTLVNYRASLKYELHKDLNQYLSCFVNRPLTYPAYEYTAKRVDNILPLPSSDMIEIFSFSFNPMFTASYSGRMVVHDFDMTFDRALGFVDKNGQKIDIDSNSLDCIYVVKGRDGFVQKRGSSVVFPGWQKLSCTPNVGEDDFYPEYVTIVASKKHVNPDSSKTPPTPIASQSQHPRHHTIPTHSSSNYVVDLKLIYNILIAVVCVALILN